MKNILITIALLLFVESAIPIDNVSYTDWSTPIPTQGEDRDFVWDLVSKVFYGAISAAWIALSFFHPQELLFVGGIQADKAERLVEDFLKGIREIANYDPGGYCINIIRKNDKFVNDFRETLRYRTRPYLSKKKSKFIILAKVNEGKLDFYQFQIPERLNIQHEIFYYLRTNQFVTDEFLDGAGIMTENIIDKIVTKAQDKHAIGERKYWGVQRQNVFSNAKFYSDEEYVSDLSSDKDLKLYGYSSESESEKIVIKPKLSKTDKFHSFERYLEDGQNRLDKYDDIMEEVEKIHYDSKEQKNTAAKILYLLNYADKELYDAQIQNLMNVLNNSYNDGSKIVFFYYRPLDISHLTPGIEDMYEIKRVQGDEEIKIMKHLIEQDCQSHTLPRSYNRFEMRMINYDNPLNEWVINFEVENNGKPFYGKYMQFDCRGEKKKSMIWEP